MKTKRKSEYSVKKRAKQNKKQKEIYFNPLVPGVH